MSTKYLVTADAIGIPGEAPEVPPVPVVTPSAVPTYAFRNDVVTLPDAVAKELLEHGVIKPINKASDEEKAAAEAKQKEAEDNRARAELEKQQEAETAAAILAAQQKANDAQAAATDAKTAAVGAPVSEATEEEQNAVRDEFAKARAASSPTAKQKLLLEAYDMGLELTGTAQALQERIDAEKKLREGDNGTGE